MIIMSEFSHFERKQFWTPRNFFLVKALCICIQYTHNVACRYLYTEYMCGVLINLKLAI